ncbi:MAG: DUF2147 domain-containing protein [Hyphomicrobiaceae bacterium]|nr:DUF2147 domain-containing protein [Hyphomicrobiaceae bacterium]
MRHRILAAVAVIALAATTAHAADPYGTWTRPSNGAKVNFSNCGGKLCATVVSSPTKGAAGKQIMSGAAKTGDNVWKGDLLNTEDGQTYSGVVTLEGPKALNLKGCVLGGIVCKGETWVR